MTLKYSRREAVRKLGLFLGVSPLIKGQCISRAGHERIP